MKRNMTMRSARAALRKSRAALKASLACARIASTVLVELEALSVAAASIRSEAEHDHEVCASRLEEVACRLKSIFGLCAYRVYRAGRARSVERGRGVYQI